MKSSNPKSVPLGRFPRLVGFALVLAHTFRLVRNAFMLQHRYRAAVRALGDTYAQVLEKKPAPDPTTAFIGENWWKLPTTFGSVLLALWVALEWAGVAQTVQGAFRRGLDDGDG